MLGSNYVAHHPPRLRKLVLVDAPASVELMLRGENALRTTLPEDLQEVLDRCERTGQLDLEEYENACGVYYKRHLCRLDPWLKEIETALGYLKDDPTVFKIM